MAKAEPQKPNTLEGYDDAQRAEILEAEGRNPKDEDRDLVDDLKPDKGQGIVDAQAPEEKLHREGGEGS